MDGGRDVNLGQRFRQPGGAIADQHTLLDQRPHDLLHEEGVALGFLDDQPLERLQACIPAEQRVKHLVGALAPQRIEAQLGVTGAVAPLVMVLGPVVDQHEDARTGDAVHEQVQKFLGLRVDPVQVLEDHHQRLLEALTDDDALDRLQRAPASYLRIHHRQ